MPYSVFDNLMEGVWVVDFDQRYLYVNETAARQARKSRADLIGRAVLEAYPGRENTEVFSVLRSCLEERHPGNLEMELVFADGTRGWFELRFEPVPEGTIILSVDVSARKATERALLRSHRALEVLVEYNHSLVRASNEAQLLQDLCDIVVNKGGYRLAWIGLKADSRTVRPIAAAGVDNGYLANLEITWDDSARGRGPTGRAIRSGKTVVARRLDTETDFEPWRKAALERGFVSSAALPFFAAGSIAGALNIYASEPDAFGDAEREVLEELALDLGYGIDTLRARVARQDADDRYRALFENSLDAVLLARPDGAALAANPAACQLFGLTEEEFRRMGRSGVVDTEDPRFLPLMETRRAVGKMSGTLRMRRKDGSTFEADVSSALFQTTEGPRVSVFIRDVTARVLATLKLEQSEKRYRDLYDNAPDMFVSVDAGTATIVRCNDTLSRTIGRAKREIVKTSLFDLCHPESQDAARHAFEQFTATGQIHNVELKLACSQGRTVDASLSMSPLRDAQGSIVEGRAVLRDITHLKAAQTALAESEARYQLLLEHAPVGVAVHSDGQIVFANSAGVRMLGYDDPAELVGTSIDRIVHPDNLQAAQDRISRMLAGEQVPYPVEDRYLRKDGSIADVEVMGVPLVFRGSPAVQVIVSDITERKRAERALRESEALFSSIFRSSPLGIDIFRIRDGRSVAMNDAFLDLIGYSREQAEGRTVTELGLFVDDEVREAWMQTLLSGGDVQNQQTRFRTKSAEIRDILASLKVVEIDGERLIMVIASDITSLRQAQDALKENEERFRHMFEAANVGKSLTLPTGQVSVNQAFADMLGYDREELANKHWHDLTPVEDIEPLSEIMTSLLEGRCSSARFSKRYVCKDGTLSWGDVSTVMWRDRDGKPAYFITTVVDISEQRRAVDALRASEERFSHAFHAGPAGMAITRMRDGRFIEVNDAFLRMFGFDRDEVIGSNPVDLGIVDSSTRAQLVEAQVQSGGLRDADLSARDKSGQLVNIVFSSKPMTVDGEACLITTMIDVTERRSAEAQLRSSEERYRRLAKNLPDMVWRTDPQGKVLFVNSAVRSFVGYTPDEVCDRPMAAHLAPSSVNRVAQWFSLIQGGESGPSALLTEVEYLHKDGHVVEGEMHAVPVFDDGRLSSVEGVTRDIRARKKAEREKAEMQNQLRIAQKLESVGRLAGGVAHDFNNLLSVIINYADFAAAALGESHPMFGEIVEIRKAGERAAALTRQLLAFSRKQMLDPVSLDLNQVVSTMERMLRRLLGEDIEIEVHLADGLASVLADPSQIEQVIMNLAVNGRDAMPTGGKLAIETANVEFDESGARHVGVSPGRYVLLAVSDTGAGMAAETREHVFEPFFTTKEKGRGTGLGLATVYGIVTQSGGSIQVSSEPGRGTIFKVYLPQANLRSVNVPRRPAPSSKQGGESVLIVEDEDVVRRIAERILNNAGYRVLTAESGSVAESVCEQHAGSVDLLLTDVVMPGMSGRDLADRLTQRYSKLKVLYMSGYTEDAIVHRGVLVPGTRLLGKPFGAAELLSRVRQVLEEEPR